MAVPDRFNRLAPIYDALMAHVDYDRWFVICHELSTLLTPGFTHLDAACGTGALLERTRKAGWVSFGFDLSPAMLRNAAERTAAPLFVGNLEAIPVHAVDFITCLFDSMNFLQSMEAVRRALQAMAAALKPGGLLYFDMVTELLMAEVFGNQSWVEPVENFMLTWESRWFPESASCLTRLTRDGAVVFECEEKAYATEAILDLARQSGLEPLAVLDARSWRPPARDTTRIDYLFTPSPSRLDKTQVQRVLEKIRYNLS